MAEKEKLARIISCFLRGFAFLAAISGQNIRDSVLLVLPLPVGNYDNRK